MREAIAHIEFLSDLLLIMITMTIMIMTYICVLSKATLIHWGTRWRSWLRHCATSRKVAGSIPDGVTGIFRWHNPSGSGMALGLAQLLTEMSTRNVSWGYRWSVCRADKFTTFKCRLSWNLGASTSWNPQGLSGPVMGLLYLYLLRTFITKIQDVLQNSF